MWAGDMDLRECELVELFRARRTIRQLPLSELSHRWNQVQLESVAVPRFAAVELTNNVVGGPVVRVNTS